jgi:hypothetical protein
VPKARTRRTHSFCACGDGRRTLSVKRKKHIAEAVAPSDERASCSAQARSGLGRRRGKRALYVCMYVEEMCVRVEYRVVNGTLRNESEK